MTQAQYDLGRALSFSGLLRHTSTSLLGFESTPNLQDPGQMAGPILKPSTARHILRVYTYLASNPIA